jgi:hypothetical protein
LCLKHVEHWERIASRWRPAFSSHLTDYLEHERSLSEFLEDFPSVSRADAIAALEAARISLAATLK